MRDEPGGPERAWSASAAEIVLESIIRQETGDLDRPHVVCISDGDDVPAAVMGPYPDAMAAAAAAEQQRASDLRELGESADRRYELRVLLAPVL
jgi:hypothetical protein